MNSISDWAEKTPEGSGTNWTDGETASSSAQTPESKPAEEPTPTSSETATPTPPADLPKESAASVAAAPTATTSAPVATAPSADEILSNVLGRIGDIGTSHHFKLMIIGPPGQGKSSLLASANNMLAYDFEDGLISAKAAPHGVGKGTKAIPYVNMDEFRTLVGALMNKHEALSQFEVFGIDTLSDLHKRDLAEITERDWRRQPSRNRYVPETDQYTEVNERIVRVVRALRDLPLDIIITSHSRTVEPKNGPSKTYADFSESLSNKVMAMMDVVGYLQFKKVGDKMVPVLRTKTDGVIYCKSRASMPEEIINPSYQEIKQLWLEGLESE